MQFGNAIKVTTLAGLASLLWIGVSACGVDRSSYVRNNELILETLPEIPRATRVEVVTSPYGKDDGETIIGYGTRVVYEAPPEFTAEDIVDFYVQNLPKEWDADFNELRNPALPGEQLGAILSTTFFRGEATITIHTAAMAVEPGFRQFEVYIDHSGNRCGRPYPPQVCS